MNRSFPIALYALNGKLQIDSLKELCKQAREYYDCDWFHLTLFDSNKNTQFSNSPLSAQYGMEEDKMIHLKAYYNYNKLNGFEELTVYDPNMWEGKPKKIVIN